MALNAFRKGIYFIHAFRSSVILKIAMNDGSENDNNFMNMETYMWLHRMKNRQIFIMAMPIAL